MWSHLQLVTSHFYYKNYMYMYMDYSHQSHLVVGHELSNQTLGARDQSKVLPLGVPSHAHQLRVPSSCMMS